jgi:Anti-sigma-K factor rskA
MWESMGGGVLVVSGLQQPPIGRTYQLWLGSISLGNRISGGLLAVDSLGAGTLRVAPPRATWSPDIFGVTMERQGGAREPSDDLVLVGELPRQSGSAVTPALPVPGASAPPAPAETRPGGAPESASASATETPSPIPPVTPPVTPPPAVGSVRGPEGELVRVVAVPVERTFTVAQSVLKSLGWDIGQVDQVTGVIRTEPRNMTFKDFGVYAEGMRHSLDVVVRAVSDGQTSISVRRAVFEERRIFWSKERKVLPTPETAVEQTLLDAIERLL